MHIYQPLPSADRPRISSNRSGPGPVECAIQDPCELDLLFVGARIGGSRCVLLAGWSCAELTACGGGVLLRAALAEHAGWHGGPGIGQSQSCR